MAHSHLNRGKRNPHYNYKHRPIKDLELDHLNEKLYYLRKQESLHTNAKYMVNQWIADKLSIYLSSLSSSFTDKNYLKIT